MEKSKERVLSCIQPTGVMHIGNYFGAVKNWLHLQETYSSKFGIVNYHAMTVPFTPSNLVLQTEDMVLNLVACGIEPENIFIQSYLPEHLELCWIFSCCASFDLISSQSQFKNKKQQLESTLNSDSVTVGLFNFPLLQSADILIHKTNLVPIGKDLLEHLKLVANIATSFNDQFNTNLLTIPEPLLTDEPEVLSLTDPTKKMSKSHGEAHYIGLFDRPEVISEKIWHSMSGLKKMDSMTTKLFLKNAICILKSLGKEEQCQNHIEDHSISKLKHDQLALDLIEGLTQLTEPIIEKKINLEKQRGDILHTIKKTSLSSRSEAHDFLQEIKSTVGLFC